MQLSKYETFMEVVRTESMSKAAYNLHQTVPGVSYAISKLEEEWGITLFNRNRNKVSLTSEGEELMAYVTEVLKAQEKLDQAVLAIKGVEKGTVRVGGLRAATKLWLPPIMQYMHEVCPNIEIKIVLNLYEEIKKDLLEGVLDVAFASEPTSKMLGFTPLGQDPYVVVMPKGHPLAGCERISLAELEGERLILPDWNFDKTLNHYIERSKIKDKVSYFIKDSGTMISLAKSGMGVAVIPRLLLEDNKSEVDWVPLEDWPARKIGLVVSNIAKPSPATKKFIRHAKEWFESQGGVVG